MVFLSEWLICRALKTPASSAYSRPCWLGGIRIARGNSLGRSGVFQGVRFPASFTWIRLAPVPWKVRRSAVARLELPFVLPCR